MADLLYFCLSIFVWYHHGFTSIEEYMPGRIRETQGAVWRGTSLGG